MINWDREEFVYLASADNWKGLEQFLAAHSVIQCKHFYSVIGGLGGLNLIPELNELESLTFFDLNPHMLRIFELQEQLIRAASSVNEYLDSIFLAKLPKLTPLGEATYNHFYRPVIAGKRGPSVHCAQLLRSYEPPSLTTPMVCSVGEFDKNNINSFFSGKGWLESDEKFLRVKQALSLPTNVLPAAAEELVFQEHAGLYGSNIWNTSGKFDGWRQVRNKVTWLIGYDDHRGDRVIYYAPKVVSPTKVFGVGNGNSHATCCEALNYFIDLNAREFLEVIEPHPTYGMEFGFRFYQGQRRISVVDFEARNFPEKVPIVVVHILLGAGISPVRWKALLKKATVLAKTLIIVEHRAECSDFLNRQVDWDVHPECLLPEVLLDEAIYGLRSNFIKSAAANLKGDIADYRNVIYYSCD